MTATVTAAPRRSRTTAPAAPARPARPRLRVVEAEPRRVHAGAIGAVVVLVVFGALFANAVFHSVLVSGQQRLDDLHTSVAQEQARNQRARLRVAELEAPGRIVDAAEADGMILPDHTNWLAVQPDQGTVVSSSSERAKAPATDERAAGADGSTEQAAGQQGTGSEQATTATSGR